MSYQKTKYRLIQGGHWGQYELLEEPDYRYSHYDTTKVGDMVVYTITEEDAKEINRRRTNPVTIAERIDLKQWPLGAQAHIGNEAAVGDQYPMVITRKWSDACVNGQVFLDGTDTMWKTSVMNNCSIGIQGSWFKYP